MKNSLDWGDNTLSELNTEFVGTTTCKNGLPWEIRKNDDILEDNMLYVRKNHLGFIAELRIGKELD